MSRRSPILTIADIIEAIEKIECYLDKKSYHDENKNIPWHDIIGLRNRIVHGDY